MFSNKCTTDPVSAMPRLPFLAGWNVRVLFLLLLPTFLTAATYYASPSGNDSNPGTHAQPFRTVSRGIQAANPGDTIVLQDGTYPADTPYGGGSTNGWLLWINKSGTSGSPITLQAEHKQMAILDCGNAYNSPQTGCMGYIYLGNPAPAYWVFQDLVFTRTYDIAFLVNASNAAHDIAVKGCMFDQIGQHATSITTGMDGVYVSQGNYNMTFDGNVFHDIGRVTAGSTYPFNDHALYLHSTNTMVMNNVFYGFVAGWGVQTALGFGGVIANNTFAFTSPNDGGQVMLWDVDSNVSVENNIFYNPPLGVALNSYSFTPASCTLSHNLVYGGTLGGISACTASNTVVANPNFVNAAGDNFQLQAGSPAIDAGVTVSGVSTDYNGVSRPQGSAFDIGAFEFATATDQAPVISAVAAPNVTYNSATITWTTDKTADSQVQYGPTGYTRTTGCNTAQVTQHTASLANLTASTTYHYSVLSRDSSGTLATSGDFTFTTAAPPPPPPPAFTFSLSASGSSVQVNPGLTATDKITATLLTGTAQTVSMSASGLPAGVTASFSPSSCAATCTTTLTLSASSVAAAGTYAFTVSGTSGSATVSTNVTLIIVAPVQGAVASWAFNEGSGTTTADASGNGNTGVLMGNTAWVTGTFGTALSFSGSGAYINVKESASLELSKTMTVAFWVNASNVTGDDQRIVSKNYDWDVKLNGSSHAPQLSSGSKYAQLNYSLPMGSWVHVAFTLSSGVVTGYINGAPIGMSSNTFTSGYSLPASQYGLYIGTDAGLSQFAKGMIDDVRIYNQALTAAQVSALYSQTKH